MKEKIDVGAASVASVGGETGSPKKLLLLLLSLAATLSRYCRSFS